MSHAPSPSANRPCGPARVCRASEVVRWTVCAHREKQTRSSGPACSSRKRAPKGPYRDEELAEQGGPGGLGPGWVSGSGRPRRDLRQAGVLTSNRRLLRGRDCWPRAGPSGLKGPRPMIGPSLTDEGNATIFFVVDHCKVDCAGIHTARPGEAVRGDRGAAAVGEAQLRVLHGGDRPEDGAVAPS